MSSSSKKQKVQGKFPVPLDAYKKLSIDPFTTESLSAAQKQDLKDNIELCRNAIVFFTACRSSLRARIDCVGLSHAKGEG